MEDALWDAYRASRSDADRNALVEWYLPLVARIAQRLIKRMPWHAPVEVNDLVNDAAAAVMTLIETYDPARGAKFETYASPRIRGAMIDAIRELDWVPRLERLRVKRDPLRPIVQTFPLASTKCSDYERPLIDFMSFALPGVPDARSRLDDEEFWQLACRGLDKTDRLTLLLYYREGLTLVQVGKQMGVSESTVSLRLKSILTRLRQRRLDELKS